MRIIGVTGPSGSGKSLLGKVFAQKGIPTIDADQVYHSMLIPPSPCLDAIRAAFGDYVFCDDGCLDRTRLSEIVFNNAEKLELLNHTVLGMVLDEIRRIIRELSGTGASAVIVDAPTLIESGFHKECDIVVTVLAPVGDRVRRISARDGIDTSKASERVSAQKPDSFYTNASHIVIHNDGDEDTFIQKLSELFETVLTDGQTNI